MHAPNDGMPLMSLSRAIPILFSAPLVLALLAGRKTQTRRLAWREVDMTTSATVDGVPTGLGVPKGAGQSQRLPSPWRKVQPGDRLWVRENCWSEYRGHDGTGVLYPANGAWIKTPDTQEAEEKWTKLDCYASSRHPDNDTNSGQLVPSIHMPRWASRLTLTVTEVRVQRVQEISEADAQAEGARDAYGEPFDAANELTDRRRFQLLWNSLHGPGAWETNPEVVALTFTVEQQNIDA